MDKKFLLRLAELVRTRQAKGMSAKNLQQYILHQTKRAVERGLLKSPIAGPAGLEIALEQVGVRNAGLTGLTKEDTRLSRALPGYGQSKFGADGLESGIVDNEIDPAEAGIRNAVDFATVGAGDEIMGGVHAVADNQPGAYARGRDEMRDKLTASQAQHPLASFTGMIAGGVPAVATAPGAFAAQGGRAAVQAARKTAVQQAPGFGRQALEAVGRTARGGAAYGGLYGFNSAEGNVGNRLPAGAVGAGVGGAVGLGVGLAGVGMSSPLAGMAFMQRRAQLDNVARTVRKKLSPSLRATGHSAEELVAQQATRGREATLADTDLNFMRQAGAAAEAGEAVNAAGGPVERLMDRGANAGNRIRANAYQNMGIAEEGFAVRMAREDADGFVRTVADAHYGPLETSGVELPGHMLDDWIRTNHQIRKIVQEVKPHRISERPVPSSGNTYVGENMSFTEAQDMSILLRERTRSADLAGQPNRQRLWRQAAETVEDALTEVYPAFAPANAAYRESIMIRDAFDQGMRGMAARNPEVARLALEKLAPAAQRAYKLGMLEHVEGTLLQAEGRRQGAAAMPRMGVQVRDKLKLMFPDEQSAAAFEQFARTEGRFGLTEAHVYGRSPTSARIETRESLFGAVGMGGMRDRVFNRLIATFSDPTMRRQIADRIGSLTLSVGPEGARDFIMLMKSGRALEEASTIVMREAATRRAGAVGGLALSPDGRAGPAAQKVGGLLGNAAEDIADLFEPVPSEEQ